ncbi:hypothetical protein F5050DRAFT_1890359 [Lentinula boryana]|uniref:Uncharacterized protein n=1 Tax=Lentinula boryana TaxID=40481 RepID=A0ABQ8PXZ5_9AGAR|nr:hypothetical protein F5050DRAFT_1890359 [Lentinula boryana]
MTQNSDGQWELEIVAQWPILMHGFDYYHYGDTDGDAPNYLNMSAPPFPHLAWSLIIYNSTMTWSISSRPIFRWGHYLRTSSVNPRSLAVLIFMRSFYGIKLKEYGVKVNSLSQPLPDFQRFLPS